MKVTIVLTLAVTLLGCTGPQNLDNTAAVDSHDNDAGIDVVTLSSSEYQELLLKINELTERVGQLENDKIELENSYSQTQLEIFGAQTQLSEHDDAIGELISDIASVNTGLADMESSIQILNNHAIVTGATINELSSSVDDLSNALELINENTIDDNELQSIRCTIASHSIAIDLLNAYYSDLSAYVIGETAALFLNNSDAIGAVTSSVICGSFVINNSLDAEMLKPITWITGSLVISAPGISIDLPNLEMVQNLVISEYTSTASINLPQLRQVEGSYSITNNTALTNVPSTPNLVSIGQV